MGLKHTHTHTIMNGVILQIASKSFQQQQHWGCLGKRTMFLSKSNITRTSSQKIASEQSRQQLTSLMTARPVAPQIELRRRSFSRDMQEIAAVQPQLIEKWGHCFCRWKNTLTEDPLHLFTLFDLVYILPLECINSWIELEGRERQTLNKIKNQ